ncbi:MAG: AraC family transcriptional regulator [Ramlibacter sp.]|nr:AraC family transcriptional regulator [Ramlibacter sp.]
MDRLSFLLQQFSLRASVFYSGPLRGVKEFAAQPHHGHLHLVVRGPVRLTDDQGRVTDLAEPSVIFVPRAAPHQLIADRQGPAELVCASVNLGGEGSPMGDSLPAFLQVPLQRLPGTDALLGVLLQEAFDSRCGRQAALDRLCELLLIRLFRFALDQGLSRGGTLAGLADARLAKALLALHEDPARPWTLEQLAAQAGMSRARFAARFHTVVGQTPADYLAGWRVGCGQRRLREGLALKLVAQQVGYGSASAFTRAFARRVGCAPTEWLRQTTPAGAWT